MTTPATPRTITVEALAAALKPYDWAIDESLHPISDLRLAAAIFAALPAEAVAWCEHGIPTVFIRAALPAEPAGAGLREALERLMEAVEGIGMGDAALVASEHGFGKVTFSVNPAARNLCRVLVREARAALAASPSAGVDVERLAAALIPVTRGLWGIDDMTAWRKRTAAAIAAAYDAEEKP